jgi:serine/threonine-protein kinase
MASFARGERLGPYETVEMIGSGGMGEVWKARDPRLGRIVAIKISKAQFSERFEREARAVAALNHPHICQLYDVGPNYLVMEYIEGALLTGPLPLEKAVEYAGQILEALDAAHSKGITHRDLKPANILVTKQGIKLLDFGLAKQTAPIPGEGDSTLTEALTSQGHIVGTLQYMSPEQLQGKPVDGRSDLFSFGWVLYEMLTGKRAFDGQSAASVIGAILEREPAPLTAAPPLERIVRRALAKDPDQRFQTARDLKAAMNWAIERPALARARASWIPWAAAVVLLAVVATWGWLRSRPAQPRPVSRWTVSLAAVDPGNGFGIAVSRDGAHLAYAEKAGGTSRIVVRSLDHPEAKPVPGTEGGVRPFFSPDGQWLSYFTGLGGPLKKIAVTGGTPITLCENARPLGGSWGDDSRIVFSDSGGNLTQVSASGGKCEILSALDQPGGTLPGRWPQVLPGGGSLLLTTGTTGSYDNARIAVLDRAKGSVRTLVDGASSGRYVPSGHLVYVRNGVIFGAPFDLKHLSITGSEVPIVEGVFYNSAGGFADYAFTDTGILLYMQETRPNNLASLDWVDRGGESQHSSLPPGRYAENRGSSSGSNLRLSPDGRRAAVPMSSGPGSIDIWMADLSRGALSRVTSEGVNELQPVWTPDGTRVAFASLGKRERGIYWVPADGSGKAELLVAGENIFPDAWTPDGKTLLYETRIPSRIWVFTLPASGSESKPRMLFEGAAYNESQAQLSPDGRWVAYVSDESGRAQVYARPFPGLGSKAPISIEGGENPRWSADGREIFYLDPARNQVMAVSVEAGNPLRLGQPHTLFEQRTRDWDVTPDGKRFLVRRLPQTDESQAKLQVVVNWFEEVARKSPPGQ